MQGIGRRSRSRPTDMKGAEILVRCREDPYAKPRGTPNVSVAESSGLTLSDREGVAAVGEDALAGDPASFITGDQDNRVWGLPPYGCRVRSSPVRLRSDHR